MGLFKKLKKLKQDTGKGLWANASEDYSMWKAKKLCDMINYAEKHGKRDIAKKDIQNDKDSR